MLATAISGCGRLNGRSWQVCAAQGEPIALVIDGLAAEQAQDHPEGLVHSRALLGDTSMPSMPGVGGQQARTHPNITRPRVWWSSWRMRFATVSGWWYGSDTTPVPSRMRCERSAAAAMKSSGDAMISKPAEWCSPIHASS